MFLFLLIAAGAGGAAWWTLKRPGESTMPPPVSPAVTTPRVLVLGREHTHGLHPRLIALLDDWDANGTHVVRVPGPMELAPLGFPPAGLRAGAAAAAAQAATAAAGGSSAKTLTSTPHGPRLFQGRTVGWAVDVWPDGFNPLQSWALTPQVIKDRFRAFGVFARDRHQLEAGTFWKSSTFPDGDQPHVEVPGWRSAPVGIGVS